MTETNPPPRTVFDRVMIFIGRLLGYGLLFMILMMAGMSGLAMLWEKRENPKAQADENAMHFEGFSLSTPDPMKYWSWRAEEPERYRVKSERIDTLLIQRSFSSIEDCIAVGLKNGKTIVYLVAAGSSRRVIVNDNNVYWPRVFEYHQRDPARGDKIMNAAMDRLAERVGARVIQDLLTLSRSYYRNTHASRDLQFFADGLAASWNRLHPEAAIKIPGLPKPETYELIQ